MSKTQKDDFALQKFFAPYGKIEESFKEMTGNLEKLEKDIQEHLNGTEANIYKQGSEETDKEYIRTIELHDFEKADVETSYDQKTGFLKIAMKKRKEKDGNKSFQKREIQEYFNPNTILEDRIKAEHDNGVLKVYVPKNPDYRKSEIRQIEIE